MRLVAVHDQDGTIRSVVASPSDAPLMRIPTRPDQQIHQIEVPELSVDMDHAEIARRLDDIIENYRVDAPADSNEYTGDLPTARLSKK